MVIAARWRLLLGFRPDWRFILCWLAWVWGTLFSRSVIAFEVLKWAGAAYLIWLGIQQWRAAGAIDSKSLASTQSRRHLFQRAVFVNLTNPESIVFLVVLFPQFIMPQQPQLMQYIVLGVTTIVVDIIVMIG